MGNKMLRFQAQDKRRQTEVGTFVLEYANARCAKVEGKSKRQSLEESDEMKTMMIKLRMCMSYMKAHIPVDGSCIASC
jgi:hypothetical protein